MVSTVLATGLPSKFEIQTEHKLKSAGHKNHHPRGSPAENRHCGDIAELRIELGDESFEVDSPGLARSKNGKIFEFLVNGILEPNVDYILVFDFAIGAILTIKVAAKLVCIQLRVRFSVESQSNFHRISQIKFIRF